MQEEERLIVNLFQQTLNINTQRASMDFGKKKIRQKSIEHRIRREFHLLDFGFAICNFCFALDDQEDYGTTGGLYI